MKRFKRFLAALLSVTVMLSAFSITAFATAGETASAVIGGQLCGDTAYWEINDGVLTISGTGAIYNYDFMGEYIPDYAPYAHTVNTIIIEEGITEIGNEAFESFDLYGDEYIYSNLSEIRIPGTVRRIGDNAFTGATSIESITLPASVSTLGIQVFSDCKSLKEIKVDEANTAFTSMEGVLFTGDVSELIAYPIGLTNTEYEIPASVTRIRESAFLCETDLEKVLFPEGLESIADVAFNSCSNLNEVYLPDTLKTIGGDVFQNCTSLADFTLPSTIESIGAYSFANTAYYNNYANWTDGVLYYENVLISGKYVYEDVENDDLLLEIFEGACSVAEGTTLIANEAFIFCDVTSVSFPPSLKHIGNGAFYCTYLSEIEIPDGVEYIGEEAFRSCTDLATVTLGDNIQRIGSGAFNETAYAENSENYTNGLLYNGKYLLDFDANLTGEVAIREGTTLLADGAFFYESGEILKNKGSNISSVTFPSTLTSISEKAFLDCENLSKVCIPSTVTEIGDYAFGYRYSYDYSVDRTKYLPISGFSIICAKDSAAEQYAIDNSIDYSCLAQSIRLSSPACTLYAGRNMTCQLTTAFLPEGSGTEAVTYHSGDEEIATVNEDGLVTLHSKTGTVEITAVTESGLTDTVSLTVSAVNTLTAGESYLLTFDSSEDVQYYRFVADEAGIYNFNYETDRVATTLYTVGGNVIYADIPAGSFSANLPADTSFELRLKCTASVDEEILTIVPPVPSGGSTDEGEEDDPKRLTADDVESVVIEPIKMFENTYGDWQTYYDEETEEEETYYCYNWSSFISYTIFLKNGDKIEAPDGYFSYDGIYYAGSHAHAHKSYEERWLVNNTYTEKLSILGEEYDLSITIARPPIKSIRCDVDEIVILEGSYCDILSTNPSSAPLYHYRWYEAANWIVEFQDGREITTYNRILEIEDHYYHFDFSDSQGTLQSWTAGNTYTAHAKFMGLACDVEVTISDSFIKDITFKDIYVYENADGNYHTEYNFDTGERTQWFYYNWRQYVEYEVTFVPGVDVTDYGNGFYYNGEYYGFEKHDTQSFYTPWVDGVTYTVELAVFGKKYTTNVTVLPNPIKEVQFESIVIPQGYGSTYTEYDALLNEEFTYFRYNDHDFEYSVTFHDGTSVIGETNTLKYDGREYSPSIVGGVQTHDNIWEPGHAYQITVQVMGVDTIVPVYIEPIEAAEGFGYFYNYRGEISITESNTTDTRLTIPAEIGEYVVTEIFSLDLAEDLVEELVLPKTIKDLGRFDFTSMENLKTIYYAGSEYEWDYISHYYSGYGDIEIVYDYLSVPPAAVLPTCQSVGVNSVTLTAIEGYEYSLDGINWQSSNVFTQLSPATEYTFYQRYAATNNSQAGEASPCLIVKTSCPHAYDNACDKSCNICGETRSITHVFSDATCTAPKTCKVCRVISGTTLAHTYTNVCDRTCNTCGQTRTIAGHTYTDASDTSCNRCGTFAYPGGSTLYPEGGKWYHIVNRQKVNDTTLVNYSGQWWYVKNGVVDFSSNTLVPYGGKWYHVSGGKWVKDTTLVNYGGQWWYVVNGIMNTSNTLVKYNNQWFHVNGGKWVKDTTLVPYGGKWWYVQGGIMKTATTLVNYGGQWWYVKDGIMNTSNTLVKYNNQWFHVNGGKWVKDTTLVSYGGQWWYVKGGIMNTSNTLVKYNNQWFHVNGGKWVKDTTLVPYGGKWYYVRNGIVNFAYNGRVLYGGRYYNVRGGIKV